MLTAVVHVSRTQNIIFLIISLLLFAFAAFLIYLYIRRLRREKVQKTDLLAKPKATDQIVHFWSHVVYLFLIFTAIVGGIVLFFVSVGGKW